MYDVIVIGGGLAGCSAAIHLVKRGLKVLVLERQRYPVHKLCGEFLSVEVQSAFERLGVLDAVREARPHPITQVYVTTSHGASFEGALPGTALGLSRYRLDHLLFERATERGADGRQGATVRTVSGDLKTGFVVNTGEETFRGRVVCGAYGKRGIVDRKLDRPFMHQKAPYVAFKAHYEGLDLGNRVELHAFPGGYCGLSHVEEGKINACWIVHEAVFKASGRSPEGMIRGAFNQNSVLARRFSSMRRITEEILAISQISFAFKSTFEKDLCMLGDTAGMIAPLCGDGMAMALRSSELAAPFLADFVAGETSVEAMQQEYATAWRREFLIRFLIGRWLHKGYTQPVTAQVGVRTIRLFPALAKTLIRLTRG